MKDYRAVRVCLNLVNIFLVVSLSLVLCCLGWEFSTRSYLKGFSDAIVPYSDNPEQKVQAILSWMQHGPARRSTADPNALDARNPEDTLNYRQLLEVCGTATNAFLNLAQSSGVHARRLLLLDQNKRSKHVVTETLMDNRWVIVDPSFHTILRLPTGLPATRQELRNPEVFRAATQSIPNYPSIYNYESSVHVRLNRIPFAGNLLRRVFDFIWPSWEESINWTLVVERESFAALTVSVVLLWFALTVRFILGWYSTQRLGVVRLRLRDRLEKVGEVLFSNTK